MNAESAAQRRIIALREGLIAEVEGTPRRKLSRARRVGTSVVSIVAGVVLVGASAAATATSAGLWNKAESWPGGLGTDSYKALTEVVTVEGTGSVRIDLPTPPSSATTLSVQFSCKSPGTFTWDIKTHNTGSSRCEEPETLGRFSASKDITLSSTQPHLYVGADDDASWELMYRYAEKHETEWGVNDQGETFGYPSSSSLNPLRTDPDLVAVDEAWFPGHEGPGYINDRKDGPPMPNNPSEAMEYMEMMERDYPDGYPIPVYESDGVTVIGEFLIGGNPPSE